MQHVLVARLALLIAVLSVLFAVEAARGRTAPAKPPPCRAITHGPKFHWFGYYDKLQFDPTDRYVLGMEVGFEHRSPKADDTVRVGMVDLADGDKWIDLGDSRAWNWQQGCMLQWLGKAGTEVVWNDREGDRFVCRVMDVRTRKRRTIAHAVYTISPDSSVAVSPDFRRIQDMRPGYGYAGPADPHAADMAPAGSGIWRIDMRTGEAGLIIRLADIANVGTPDPSMKGAKHYFNHLLFGPDGKRFIFLHRWRPDGGKGGFITRLLTADTEGRNLRVVDPSGCTSHFIWKDPNTITAWSRPKGRPWGFYEFDERTGAAREIGEGVMTANGHNTYLPVGSGTEWILNDTYPQGRNREQSPYLFHVPTGRRYWLGHFALPPAYAGEWRCDTHPRSSRNGMKVCIDSPHGGQGRQMWLIDVRDVVGKGE